MATPARIPPHQPSPMLSLPSAYPRMLTKPLRVRLGFQADGESAAVIFGVILDGVIILIAQGVTDKDGRRWGFLSAVKMQAFTLRGTSLTFQVRQWA